MVRLSCSLLCFILVYVWKREKLPSSLAPCLAIRWTKFCSDSFPDFCSDSFLDVDSAWHSLLFQTQRCSCSRGENLASEKSLAKERKRSGNMTKEPVLDLESFAILR